MGECFLGPLEGAGLDKIRFQDGESNIERLGGLSSLSVSGAGEPESCTVTGNDCSRAGASGGDRVFFRFLNTLEGALGVGVTGEAGEVSSSNRRGGTSCSPVTAARRPRFAT